MVFPSLSFTVESGVISQVSTWFIIGFSILINYWKKATLIFVVLLSTLLFSFSAFSFAAVGTPNHCGTLCLNNQNYYGTPWGNNRPVYYYPSLQYHSIWGPTPYYFRPHGASPYRPSWYNNCPHCGNNGWNTIMPIHQYPQGEFPMHAS